MTDSGKASVEPTEPDTVPAKRCTVLETLGRMIGYLGYQEGFGPGAQQLTGSGDQAEGTSSSCALGVIGQPGVNIFSVHHDRMSLAHNKRDAVLDLVAEIQGRAHDDRRKRRYESEIAADAGRDGVSIRC